MRTSSAPRISDFFLSAAPIAVFAALVFTVVPTRILAQQQPQSCAENNGTWLEKYHECESVSQQWCHSAGGQFEECGSACRHASAPGPCTMQCIPVCKFPVPSGQDNASDRQAVNGRPVATPEGSAGGSEQTYVRESVPQLFSYDELVQLSLDEPLSPELAEKLHIVTTTPFINNEAYYAGAKPAHSTSKVSAQPSAWPIGILSEGSNWTTSSCFLPIRTASWPRWRQSERRPRKASTG